MLDASRFAEWLEACTPDSVCGEALDYDAEFLSLETALQGKPERQYGDTIIPAEKPDWRAIRSSATTLLRRSKDLRVAVALTRSLTSTEGTLGFARGVGVVSALLNNHWDDVHPRIEQDGEREPFVRVNALAALADTATVIPELRDCAFVSGSGLAISVREAESILSPTDNSAQHVTRDQLQRLLADQLQRAPEPLHAITFAEQQLGTIAWLCKTRLSSEESPDLAPAMRLLKLLSGAIAAAAPADEPSVSNDVSDGATQQFTSDSSQNLLRLKSRADAIRALEAVCEFFEQNEPSSPVPIFLNRAKKLTGMRFMDIIRDVSPESMATLEVIAGPSNSS